MKSGIYLKRNYIWLVRLVRLDKYFKTLRAYQARSKVYRTRYGIPAIRPLIYLAWLWRHCDPSPKTPSQVRSKLSIFKASKIMFFVLKKWFFDLLQTVWSLINGFGVKSSSLLLLGGTQNCEQREPLLALFQSKIKVIWVNDDELELRPKRAYFKNICQASVLLLTKRMWSS